MTQWTPNRASRRTFPSPGCVLTFPWRENTSIYLNSCTFGPFLRSVLRCMADALREENEEVIAIRGKVAGVRFYERAEKARQSVAELLGVSASEMAKRM